MVLNVHRNRKVCVGVGRKGEGRGYEGGRRGRLYSYRYTVTTSMTFAAMRAILMFNNYEG